MPPDKIAVLLLAHGSPESAEDVPDFLLRVTSGRPLPPQAIEEITERYRLIGRSPLTQWTQKQAELLSQELRLPVFVGMRNWKPFIADTVKAMNADYIRHAVVICLAPQNSRTSVGLYRSSLMANTVSFEVYFVESWHDHPLLIKAFAQRLRTGRELAQRETGKNVPVIFTAHSVPSSTVEQGDPYEKQARETAALVANAAALPAGSWTFAFQSQGQSRGPWLGPTVEDEILALKGRGATEIFIHPIGFLCDHVEVLYDVDIAFKEFADKNGIRLRRAESLNGSALLAAALADIVRNRLAPKIRI